MENCGDCAFVLQDEQRLVTSDEKLPIAKFLRLCCLIIPDIDIVVEKKNPFKSAREQLDIDRRKNKHPSPQGRDLQLVSVSTHSGTGILGLLSCGVDLT